MQDLRTIKQRMSAIRNIRKIADAMKMVSTVKYWRLLEPMRTFRTISEEMKTFTPPALHKGSGQEPENGKKTLVLAFFPHRGMCGSLTQNLLHAVAQWYPDPETPSFAVFGKKGTTMLSPERFPRLEECPPLSTEAVDNEQVLALARFIARGVTEGRFARVEAVTAEFHNLLRQTPVRVQLFPLPETSPEEDSEVELEPDPETVFRLFLPLYLECQIRRLVHDGMVSEHAARMTAMDNASKNAQELLENFRLEYNKIRQSKITLELMEIISGSEALK